jgi:hypothetical protein
MRPLGCSSFLLRVTRASVTSRRYIQQPIPRPRVARLPPCKRLRLRVMHPHRGSDEMEAGCAVPCVVPYFNRDRTGQARGVSKVCRRRFPFEDAWALGIGGLF